MDGTAAAAVTVAAGDTAVQTVADMADRVEGDMAPRELGGTWVDRLAGHGGGGGKGVRQGRWRQRAPLAASNPKRASPQRAVHLGLQNAGSSRTLIRFRDRRRVRTAN